MNQPSLTTDDKDRLNTQLAKVRLFMISGAWKTLEEIADHVQGSEAGVSARLRDLRNKYHYTVNRRRVNDSGLHQYQVLTGPIQTFQYEPNGQAVFL